MRAGLVLAAALIALTGCTSVPQASPERDAEAKQFATHPGSATIYVYRPDFLVEDMVETVLYVNNRVIGSTLAGSFFRVDVRPGVQLLHGNGADAGRLKLETRAGELYFVSLNVVAGHSVFRLEPPETGKRDLVRCCALFENWAPGQRPTFR